MRRTPPGASWSGLPSPCRPPCSPSTPPPPWPTRSSRAGSAEATGSRSAPSTHHSSQGGRRRSSSGLSPSEQGFWRSAGDDEGLWRGLFQAGLQPRELRRGLPLAAGDDLDELLVAGGP